MQVPIIEPAKEYTKAPLTSAFDEDDAHILDLHISKQYFKIENIENTKIIIIQSRFEISQYLSNPFYIIYSKTYFQIKLKFCQHHKKIDWHKKLHSEHPRVVSDVEFVRMSSALQFHSLSCLSRMGKTQPGSTIHRSRNLPSFVQAYTVSLNLHCPYDGIYESRSKLQSSQYSTKIVLYGPTYRIGFDF